MKHKDVTLGNYAELFLKLYTAEGSATQRTYRRALIMWLAWLQNAGKCPPLLEHFTPGNVKSFVEQRLKDGAAPGTICTELSVLRSFGSKLVLHYGMKHPMLGVKNPSIPDEPPKRLTDAQMAAVLRVAGHWGRSELQRKRNVAYLTLGFDTGLRASAMLGLKLEQIDLQSGWIRNVRSKGDKHSSKGITPRLDGALRSYLELRTDKLPWLFVSTRGAARKLAYDTAKKQVQEIGDRAGVRLYSHLCRHTFAHRAIEKTKDIALVSQALDHSNPAITMRYAKRTEKEVWGTILG